MSSTDHGRDGRAVVRTTAGVRVLAPGSGRRSVVVLLLLATLVVTGCTSTGSGDDAPTAAGGTPSSAEPGTATATDGGSSGEGDGDDGPGSGDDDAASLLAPVPRSASVWASTVGLPVVGAVRTSTPLARLSVLPVEDWAATCAQVAVELDTIAAPPVLTALAVTADPETATLLVGDLRAKADLLAVCDEDTPARAALVAEVAATHEVAVAWLRAVGGDR